MAIIRGSKPKLLINGEEIGEVVSFSMREEPVFIGLDVSRDENFATWMVAAQKRIHDTVQLRIDELVYGKPVEFQSRLLNYQIRNMFKQFTKGDRMANYKKKQRHRNKKAQENKRTIDKRILEERIQRTFRAEHHREVDKNGQKVIFTKNVTFGHKKEPKDLYAYETAELMHRKAPQVRSHLHKERIARHNAFVRHEYLRKQKAKQRPFLGEATQENLDRYYGRK